MDVHTPEQRRLNMSRIRSRNTKPELAIRSILHQNGYRFRLHSMDLPGKPDIVLPRYRAVVFVHGCFWHRHECHLFRWPRTRAAFWKKKINKNFENDCKSTQELLSAGWRVCTIWECSLKGRLRDVDGSTKRVMQWLASSRKRLEVRG